MIVSKVPEKKVSEEERKEAEKRSQEFEALGYKHKIARETDFRERMRKADGRKGNAQIQKQA